MTRVGVVWLVAMWVIVVVIISCKNSVPEERERIQGEFNRLEEWEKEQAAKNPCKTFQDSLDKPNECPVHYLEGDPNFDVIIYLAEDGSVRWKAQLKNESTEESK